MKQLGWDMPLRNSEDSQDLPPQTHKMRTSIGHGGGQAKYVGVANMRKTFANQRGTMGSIAGGPPIDLFADIHKGENDADDAFFQMAAKDDDSLNQNFGLEDNEEDENK